MIKAVVLIAGLASACANPLTADLPSHALRAPGMGGQQDVTAGFAQGRRLMQAPVTPGAHSAPTPPSGDKTQISGGIDQSQKQVTGDTNIRSNDESEYTSVQGDTDTKIHDSGVDIGGVGNGNTKTETNVVDNSQRYSSNVMHHHEGGDDNGGDDGGDDKGGDDSGGGGQMSAEEFFSQSGSVENNIKF